MTDQPPLYGIPCDLDEARIRVIPVPFDATCSYGIGASLGPATILEASPQLDFEDRRFGNLLETKIAMEPIDASIAELSAQTRRIVTSSLEASDDEACEPEAAAKVDAASEIVNAFVSARVSEAVGNGQIPAVVGGEHSVSLGAIRALGESGHTFGVLQVDAHMDLRRAYQNLRYSHASVMLNMLEMVPGVEKLVQVGIRDYDTDEARFGRGRRVDVHYWDDLADALDNGRAWRSLCEAMVEPLPANVYVTFDIDGLDPTLCPNTGTPVPGGLSWDQASLLLQMIRDSGRRVIGFDLVEVAPSASDATRIDGIIGARVLYRLCGMALGPRR